MFFALEELADFDCFAKLTLPEFEQNDLGKCQHYRGVACSQLIGNKTVYVKEPMSLNKMEEKLAAIFTILATGKVMSPECHKYAVPFFCYVMFPPCDDTIPYPVPKHICKDDCDLLEASTCKIEMASARKHPLLVNQDLVPECEELPSLNQKERAGAFIANKDGQGGCISLNVPKVVHVDHDVNCYEGRGEKYIGPVSHTVSSHECLSWRPVPDFEELTSGHNFCRNPGGRETQPWCYISDPHMRREVCDIPKCGKKNSFQFGDFNLIMPGCTSSFLPWLLQSLCSCFLYFGVKSKEEKRVPPSYLRTALQLNLYQPIIKPITTLILSR
ncbi:tyrosine-protein kinase transmembrane receptor ROR2-like [Uloborus diversus]|uniref:tyrosine-protein kinase transmembrane receptor ROR2-like n=1 Tax=Uloborus diversus TaxID=327109 RepID=UPI002409E6D9|nr:tyrosine-protein kinase transmembrane receptor ROR2-like [Uloborus diversus]